MYCRCSKSTCEKIRKELRDAGALNIEEGKQFRNECSLYLIAANVSVYITEIYRQPSIRMLQFYVRDEPGCLAEALKAFQVCD